MEADGQLLGKPRASHESHLANISRMALKERSCRGLPPGAERGPYWGEVACSAGGGDAGAVRCGEDMPRRGKARVSASPTKHESARTTTS